MIFKDSQHTSIVYLMMAGLTLVTIALWSAIIAGSTSGKLALYFLNIGQGDSSFIQLPNGVQILIDGGPSGPALLENLAKIMPPQDRYIDLVMMSHPQLDHFAGFIDLLKKYQIGAFIGSGRRGPIAGYDELHRQIEAHGIPYFALAEGDAITAGDSKLSILGPSPSELLSGELNDTVLVTLLETPQVKALYTGDIGFVNEQRLIAKYKLDVDVLKVGHHGSRFSSGEPFLKALTPAVAVIEVGKNTYDHPTKDALDRLHKYVSQVLRTDQQGIVKITPIADALEVFSSKKTY